MQSISTIGLDIAKSVLHGVDAAGQLVVRRQLRRRHVLAFFEKLPPCLVGIEGFVITLEELCCPTGTGPLPLAGQ
jgi:transposase